VGQLKPIGVYKASARSKDADELKKKTSEIKIHISDTVDPDSHNALSPRSPPQSPHFDDIMLHRLSIVSRQKDKKSFRPLSSFLQKVHLFQ